VPILGFFQRCDPVLGGTQFGEQLGLGHVIGVHEAPDRLRSS
jgi:hypothetical protein